MTQAQSDGQPQPKKKRPSFDLFDLYGDKENTVESNVARGVGYLIEEEMREYEKMKVAFDESHLVFNILSWWQCNSAAFPILSKFARYIHAIPATSSASERTFSAAGNIITDKRSCLLPDTLSSMLLLKSNWDLRT